MPKDEIRCPECGGYLHEFQGEVSCVENCGYTQPSILSFIKEDAEGTEQGIQSSGNQEPDED